NVLYPKNVPVCIIMVQADVPTTLNPRPPSLAGMERKRGTQVNSPHHAKSVAAFMLEHTSVLRPSVPRKRLLTPACECLACLQVSGSERFLRSQTVTNAGAMPAKNTARHPNRGITSATTTPASA